MAASELGPLEWRTLCDLAESRSPLYRVKLTRSIRPGSIRPGSQEVNPTEAAAKWSKEPLEDPICASWKNSG